MVQYTRRMFLWGLSCLQAAAAHAGETRHGYRKLYPRNYDDGLIPRFSFELIEMSLGGRLGAYLLDLETGRASSWSPNTRFDATPVADPMLIAAAQWAVATSKLAWTGRYTTCSAQGMPRRATLDDLCSSLAAAPDPVTRAALQKILTDRQLLTGFLQRLDGEGETPTASVATVISCAPEPLIATTPWVVAGSLRFIFRHPAANRNALQLLQRNARPRKAYSAGVRSGVPASWPVFCRTAVTPDGNAASVAVVFPPSRAPLLMSFFIAESRLDPQSINGHLAELARISTTNLLLPALDPYPDD